MVRDKKQYKGQGQLGAGFESGLAILKYLNFTELQDF